VHGWVYILVNSTGVTPVTAAGDMLTVLPNPNKGVFTIRGSLGVRRDEEVTLGITDMLGQVVYRGAATARGGVLNAQVALHGVANGMYLLSIHSESVSRVLHVVVEQ
jgi:hypothetical protein